MSFNDEKFQQLTFIVAQTIVKNIDTVNLIELNINGIKVKYTSPIENKLTPNGTISLVNEQELSSINKDTVKYTLDIGRAVFHSAFYTINSIMNKVP